MVKNDILRTNVYTLKLSELDPWSPSTSSPSCRPGVWSYYALCKQPSLQAPAARPAISSAGSAVDANVAWNSASAVASEVSSDGLIQEDPVKEDPAGDGAWPRKLEMGVDGEGDIPIWKMMLTDYIWLFIGWACWAMKTKVLWTPHRSKPGFEISLVKSHSRLYRGHDSLDVKKLNVKCFSCLPAELPEREHNF